MSGRFASFFACVFLSVIVFLLFWINCTIAGPGISRVRDCGTRQNTVRGAGQWNDSETTRSRMFSRLGLVAQDQRLDWHRNEGLIRKGGMTEEVVLQGNDADWQVLAGELVDGGARPRSRFNGRLCSFASLQSQYKAVHG